MTPYELFAIHHSTAAIGLWQRSGTTIDRHHRLSFSGGPVIISLLNSQTLSGMLLQLSAYLLTVSDPSLVDQRSQADIDRFSMSNI